MTDYEDKEIHKAAVRRWVKYYRERWDDKTLLMVYFNHKDFKEFLDAVEELLDV